MGRGTGAFDSPVSIPAPAKQKHFLRVVWDFTRPHTIIGSVLSVLSVHLFAAGSAGEPPSTPSMPRPSDRPAARPHPTVLPLAPLTTPRPPTLQLPPTPSRRRPAAELAVVNLGALLRALLWALIPACLLNLYITGLNQVSLRAGRARPASARPRA